MTLKFQEGGTLPFTEYLPFVADASSGSTEVPDAAASGKAEADDMQKDLLKLIGGMKGLPSDISKIVSDLQDIYSETSLYSNGSLNPQSLITTYLSTLQKMKVAEFNENQYKQAKESVEKNDGLHEFAIDSAGRIVVQSQENGAIKHMTLKDFYDQGDDPEYLPLTNSNLLYYRAEHPDFAYKNDILEVVSNGIGQEKVTELLQKAISDIGTDTLQTEGYTVRQQQNITKGLNILADLVREGKSTADIYGDQGLLSLDGIYKTKQLTSDQKKQIEEAATYLWKAMPRNAQTWLAMRSGNTEHPEQGAYDMMLTLLLSRNSHKSEFSSTIQEDLNPDGTKKSGSGSGSDEKLRIGWLQHVQAGDGGRVASMEVNLGGNRFNASMNVTGTGYGLAITPDGKAIGQTSMYNMLRESRLLGITEGTNNIYFGEQKMSINDLNNIAYNGDEILRVNIPVKADGSPDFDLLKVYSDAQQEYLMSSQTEEDRRRIFGKPQLQGLFNPDGSPNMRRFAPFVLVNGITTDGLTKIDKNNEYIGEVTANPDLYAQIKNSLAGGTEAKPRYPDVDERGWFESLFDSWYDRIYQGVVYIPISMNRNSAAMYENQKLPQNEQDSLELEYQQNPAFLNYNTAGNSLDLLRNN